LRSILSILITIAVAIPAVAQQAPAKRIWDGVFSSTQAVRGKEAFELSCARCHNVALTGSERGPAIKGQTFLSHWEKDSLAGLFKKIRDTMPEGGSGTVKDEVKIDIVSYILQQNGFPAGGEELKLDLSSLEDIGLAKKGIWDGVFTKAQADRGKAALLQNGCNGCHGAELAGDRGPALKGERFITDWENGPVDRLFVKIRETMPPLNAQQVPPAEKIDIVAYLLAVNGFPSGSTTLGQDDLPNIQIVKRGAEAAGPPNFSLVEVVGCLTSAENRKWVLTAATEPEPTKDESSTPAALASAKNRAPGAKTFELISVGPSLNAESQKNHRVDARGLLYREDGYAALNVTSIETVSAACN
jgi:quinoprotein glucose dehydrogenase